MNNEHENIVEIQADWDRSHYSPCDCCDIGVDDMGIYQCRDCLGIFLRAHAYKLVIKQLEARYGDLWKQEYENLKEIKKLVRAKRFEQLILYIYTYTDKNGIIVTNRYFYEKRP